MVKEAVLCEHFCSECGGRLSHGYPPHRKAQIEAGKHIQWVGTNNEGWPIDCQKAPKR